MTLFRASISPAGRALSARAVKSTDAAAPTTTRTLTRSAAKVKARPGMALTSAPLIKSRQGSSTGEKTTATSPAPLPSSSTPWPTTRPALRRAAEALATHQPALASLVGLAEAPKPKASLLARLASLLLPKLEPWTPRGAHAGGSRAPRAAKGCLGAPPYRTLRQKKQPKLTVFRPVLAPLSIPEAAAADACTGLAGISSKLLASRRAVAFVGTSEEWNASRRAGRDAVSGWRTQCAAEVAAEAARVAARDAAEARVKAALAAACHPAVASGLAYSLQSVTRAHGRQAAAVDASSSTAFDLLDGVAGLFVEVAAAASAIATVAASLATALCRPASLDDAATFGRQSWDGVLVQA